MCHFIACEALCWRACCKASCVASARTLGIHPLNCAYLMRICDPNAETHSRGTRACMPRCVADAVCRLYATHPSFTTKLLLLCTPLTTTHPRLRSATSKLYSIIISRSRHKSRATNITTIAAMAANNNPLAKKQQRAGQPRRDAQSNRPRDVGLGHLPLHRRGRGLD